MAKWLILSPQTSKTTNLYSLQIFFTLVLLNINQNYIILVRQNQQNPLPFTSIISMFYVFLTDAHRRFLWKLGDVFHAWIFFY
jgi:hypothetical protein